MFETARFADTAEPEPRFAAEKEFDGAARPFTDGAAVELRPLPALIEGVAEREPANAFEFAFVPPRAPALAPVLGLPLRPK
jgi:hypothetical protein